MRTAPVSTYSAQQELPQPQRADVVYRSLTLVAMLLLLASLWIF
jgi:hypothetical protein